MRRIVNAILWFIGLVVVLFVYFVVPIGRYTLFEHTRRIADTEPAQELGRDLSATGEALKERAIDEWQVRRDAAATPASIDDPQD